MASLAIIICRLIGLSRLRWQAAALLSTGGRGRQTRRTVIDHLALETSVTSRESGRRANGKINRARGSIDEVLTRWRSGGMAGTKSEFCEDNRSISNASNSFREELYLVRFPLSYLRGGPRETAKMLIKYYSSTDVIWTMFLCDTFSKFWRELARFLESILYLLKDI